MPRGKFTMRVHQGYMPALHYPSVWAGIAGVMSSMAAELDKPYSTACFVASAFCSLIAIVMRAPPEEKDNV